MVLHRKPLLLCVVWSHVVCGSYVAHTTRPNPIKFVIRLSHLYSTFTCLQMTSMPFLCYILCGCLCAQQIYRCVCVFSVHTLIWTKSPEPCSSYGCAMYTLWMHSSHVAARWASVGRWAGDTIRRIARREPHAWTNTGWIQPAKVSHISSYVSTHFTCFIPTFAESNGSDFLESDGGHIEVHTHNLDTQSASLFVSERISSVNSDHSYDRYRNVEHMSPATCERRCTIAHKRGEQHCGCRIHFTAGAHSDLITISMVADCVNTCTLRTEAGSFRWQTNWQQRLDVCSDFCMCLCSNKNCIPIEILTVCVCELTDVRTDYSDFANRTFIPLICVLVQRQRRSASLAIHLCGTLSAHSMVAD